MAAPLRHTIQHPTGQSSVHNCVQVRRWLWCENIWSVTMKGTPASSTSASRSPPAIRLSIHSGDPFDTCFLTVSSLAGFRHPGRGGPDTVSRFDRSSRTPSPPGAPASAGAPTQPIPARRGAPVRVLADRPRQLLPAQRREHPHRLLDARDLAARQAPPVKRGLLQVADAGIHRNSPQIDTTSGTGYYYITICTHDKACMFGRVVDGDMHLNELREIANAVWHEIPEHYPMVTPDAWVVMPNHVHGIINVGVAHARPVFDRTGAGFSGRRGVVEGRKPDGGWLVCGPGMPSPYVPSPHSYGWVGCSEIGVAWPSRTCRRPRLRIRRLGRPWALACRHRRLRRLRLPPRHPRWCLNRIRCP